MPFQTILGIQNTYLEPKMTHNFQIILFAIDSQKPAVDLEDD